MPVEPRLCDPRALGPPGQPRVAPHHLPRRGGGGHPLARHGDPHQGQLLLAALQGRHERDTCGS